jgi:hypothetical protein
LQTALLLDLRLLSMYVAWHSIIEGKWKRSETGWMLLLLKGQGDGTGVYQGQPLALLTNPQQAGDGKNEGSLGKTRQVSTHLGNSTMWLVSSC